MTKNQKQKIEEQIARAMTVGDLIDALSLMKKDMPIGRSGHFGEFHSMDLDDLCVTSAFVTPSGRWRDETRERIEILSIISPDIGPDPD